MEGYGPTQIARLLTEKGVLTPTAYDYQSTGVLKNKSAIEAPTTWVTETVKGILSYREYMGDTVLGKTRSKSYKDKKTIDLPPEEWKIFENTHEPIIDRETWETVQKLRATALQEKRISLQGLWFVQIAERRCTTSERNLSQKYRNPLYAGTTAGRQKAVLLTLYGQWSLKSLCLRV